MFVDLSKLDAVRAVLDEAIAQDCIQNDIPRDEARQIIAENLGYTLTTEETCGWWFATAVSFREDQEIRKRFASQGWHAAVWHERGIRMARSCQAAMREDAEMAVLLRLLDPDLDVAMEIGEIRRLYGEWPVIHPTDVWTPWVEMKWDCAGV
jgi:hypothetical protein